MSTTDTSTAQRVRIDVDAHVASVAMVRADRHNALDEHMFRALIEATERLRGEAGVRAAVLYGEGPSFCSGLDIPSFMDGEGKSITDILEREGDSAPNWAQRAAADWHDVPAPVIAAMHGACLGGGLQIALGADLRVCAPDAKLCVMETKWGLIPDMAITRTLTRLAPIDVAKDLVLSARTISGERGFELGLVTELSDDPVARAHELAREYAQRSPDAVQRAKRLLDEAWTMEREASLDLEERLQRELIGTPNQMEAVRAGMAGEEPSFT